MCITSIFVYVGTSRKLGTETQPLRVNFLWWGALLCFLSIWYVFELFPSCFVSGNLFVFFFVLVAFVCFVCYFICLFACFFLFRVAKTIFCQLTKHTSTGHKSITLQDMFQTVQLRFVTNIILNTLTLVKHWQWCKRYMIQISKVRVSYFLYTYYQRCVTNYFLNKVRYTVKPALKGTSI
jgi:hypothetical protein